MRHGRIAGAPGGFGLALGIGVGKARFRHLHLHLVAVELPLQLRRQLVDRYHRLFEHAGQIERALADRQARGAAGLAGIELGGGTAQARRADAHTFRWRLRRQAEAADTPFGLVGLKRIERALPTRVDALDQAARRERFDGLVRGIAQRQTIGDERERAQVETIGLECAVLRRLAARRRVLKPQVAAGPARAVGGIELQVARREFERLVLQLAGQSSGHRAQHQRLQLVAERGIDSRQPEIGRAADELAVVHIGPDAQRAVAFANARVERHVATEPRGVDVGQVGVDLPVPALPLAAVHRQQGLAELAPQREAVAPTCGRRGVEPQCMAPRAVARDELHVGQ